MFLSERGFQLSFPQLDRWVQLPGGADGPTCPHASSAGPWDRPIKFGPMGGRPQLSMGIQRWWSRPALLSSFSFSTPDARQQATMGCCCPPCKHSLHFVGLLRVKCLHSSLASAWLRWYLQICAPPYQAIGCRISWPFSYFVDSVFALMQVTILVALGLVRVILLKFHVYFRGTLPGIFFCL